MEKEEKGGLRYSDLIKKGAEELKKGAEELKRRDRRTTVDDKAENAMFRLSDLDMLKQKGKPREEEHVEPLQEKKGGTEAKEQREEAFSFRDLEALKAGQKKSTTTKPPPAPSENVSGGGEDRSSERFSLKDFESFKSLSKTTIQPSESAGRHRDAARKRWWMADIQTRSEKEAEPENRGRDVRPLPAQTEGIVTGADDGTRKEAEAVSFDGPAGTRTGESETVRRVPPSEATEEAAPSGSDPAVNAGRDFVVQAGVMDASALYESSLAFLEEVKKKIVEKESPDLRPAVSLIRQITENPQQIDDLSRLTMQIIAEEDYNISHQVNVMIYALKLGFGLKYSREQLIELGLSALIHDVGMFKIPGSIALKKGKLTEREIDVIKTHVEIGREIVQSLDLSYPALADVVYEHHE